MDHTPEEVLSQRLAEAATKITVGARYAHYKHPDVLYLVTSLSLLEATEEVVVVYEQEAGTKLSFVRPLESFLATVETDRGPVPRFIKKT